MLVCVVSPWAHVPLGQPTGPMTDAYSHSVTGDGCEAQKIQKAEANLLLGRSKQPILQGFFANTTSRNGPGKEWSIPSETMQRPSVTMMDCFS